MLVSTNYLNALPGDAGERRKLTYPWLMLSAVAIMPGVACCGRLAFGFAAADRHPLAREYDLAKDGDGPLLSVKRGAKP